MLIHKRVIKALSIVAGNYERFDLDGLHVDESGAVVATNGTMLLCSKSPASCPASDFPTQPTGGNGPEIDPASSVSGKTIPTEVLKQSAQHVKGKQYLAFRDHVAIDASSNGALRLVSCSENSVSDQNARAIDATFPAWKKVMPTHQATLKVCLSADVLSNLVKAAKAVGGRGERANVVFSFTAEGNKKPENGYTHGVGVEIASEDNHDITGVIMPMRLP